MFEKPGSPTGKASEKEFIVLIAFLMSIVAISIDALLPALGVISKDLGITNQNHAQYLIGFIFIGMSAGELISGPLSDAIGRKKILYIGISLFLAGNIICFFADSLQSLLVGRLIQGIGVAGPYVAAVSIVRDRYSGRSMAKIMSLVMMIFIMVPAIAPTLGQAVMHFFSWREIFIMYMIYSVTIMIWIFLRLEETLPESLRIPLSLKNIASGIREIAGNKTTRNYTICMGLCFGSFLGYLNSSQQIFQIQFGAGELFAMYFGILALVLGAASLTNSRFVEKLGMRQICLKSYSCIVAASAIFLAVNLYMEVSLWMFMTYAVFLFFCFGLLFGNLNSIAMEPMGHIAGIAAAITGSVSSIISMLIGAYIGQLYDNTLIPIVSGFIIFGSLAILIIKNTSDSGQSVTSEIEDQSNNA